MATTHSIVLTLSAPTLAGGELLRVEQAQQPLQVTVLLDSAHHQQLVQGVQQGDKDLMAAMAGQDLALVVASLQ